MTNSSRCAACRYLRKRCTEDCVLAPYFPSSFPDRFIRVHRVFGASNVIRMLQLVPAELRAETADSIEMEAYWRIMNPVRGCVGLITRLQEEIIATQIELAQTRAMLAILGLPSDEDFNQPRPSLV